LSTNLLFPFPALALLRDDVSRLSACPPDSANRHDVSGNCQRSFRAQKDDRLRNFLRLAPAALRNRRQHRFLGFRVKRCYSLGRGRTHQPGSHSDCRSTELRVNLGLTRGQGSLLELYCFRAVG
jgi:hypothetical protein